MILCRLMGLDDDLTGTNAADEEGRARADDPPDCVRSTTAPLEEPLAKVVALDVDDDATDLLPTSIKTALTSSNRDAGMCVHFLRCGNRVAFRL